MTKEKVIIGAWYKYESNINNGIYYAKCLEINNRDDILSDAYIYNTTYKELKENIEIFEFKHSTLVEDLNEIRHILPPNHVDKYNNLFVDYKYLIKMFKKYNIK
jgi:hypothetical protein